MKFGRFFYPNDFERTREAEAIDEVLYEAELVEELGWDAVWLAEHHFAGEVVYGDPLVFGAAVAQRTKRVLIGLAVIEMALHHPVRLAVQTSLLDNLSHGRLIVGTGRGSDYNAFEYAGFGTTVTAGRERLDEAEDLLVKAWTSENLEFKGKYWQVAFPSIQPRPYQKPHPPLARACTSTESITQMARIGRPVLLRASSVVKGKADLELYRDTMLSSGFDEAYVESAVDQVWLWNDLHVAETDDEAIEEFRSAAECNSKLLQAVRERWSPPDQVMSKAPTGLLRSEYQEHPDPNANELLVGSPKRVAELVALIRDSGIKNLMLTNRGLVPLDKAVRSLKLFSEKVIPQFK